RDGERCDPEREPALEPDAAREEIRGHRGEGELERMQRLRQAPRSLRVLRQEPDGRSDERLEERGEVDADPSDQGPSVLGKATGKRGIDVLVREVERRHAAERREQPSAEAGDDDPGEPDPRGYRR